MAGTTLKKGSKFITAGQPLTAIHLITKGKIRAEYPGGSYNLGKGDVIGICELCSEIHFLGYTILEDATVASYPVNSFSALDDLLQRNSDLARILCISLFRQINTLMNQEAVSEMNCTGLYQQLMEDYQKYTDLCNKYRLPINALDNLELASSFLGEEVPDSWLSSYYIGLHHVYAGESHKVMLQEPGLSLGILRKGSLDFRKTFSLLDEQYQYRSQIMSYYFNHTGKDLFSLYTGLYYKLGQNNEDADSLYFDINQMILTAEEDPALQTEQITMRIENFLSNLSMLTTPDSAEGVDNQNATILAELAGSMDTILGFAGIAPKAAEAFRQWIGSYKGWEDKSSMEDECCKLRKNLTAAFYSLYTAIFERSLDFPDLPMPVKMFLYFGYIDEELAGNTNCITLYKLADEIEDQSRFGVYTFYHWLLAIYNGQKFPSRNEFDEDYNEYLNKQKNQGNLTDAEVSAMANDSMERVKFELSNLFPSVNKITFGRVTTFCPFFAADNVLKDLNLSYVTVAQITKALTIIRSIDYSAFYRESYDYDHMNVMNKEIIHLEYLPDVILMPNVGIRGAMWQEIEGKKRNSPSRMLLSIFHMEDITTTITRLTGEFRWELCKRVQGARWNDVTERSMTSEYFDYIQFYRKNQELSPEAKEKIRTSLQRAKNSFKEMFVRDYIIWVLFEGTGSPRLNKVARRILFTYCPFSAALNTTLEQNPLYSELLGRKRILDGQKIHRLEGLQQKLRVSGIAIPPTLTAEINFIAGKVE